MRSAPSRYELLRSAPLRLAQVYLYMPRFHSPLIPCLSIAFEQIEMFLIGHSGYFLTLGFQSDWFVVCLPTIEAAVRIESAIP